MKGKIPTCLWRSESLQPPQSPENQRVAVSQGRKQGTHPDSEGIQPPRPKVSEILVRMGKFEGGPCLSQGATWTTCSPSGGYSGCCGNLGLHRQGPRGRDKAALLRDRRQREGSVLTAKLSQTLGVSVSSRKATQERALGNCILRLWRRRQQQ